MAGASSALTFTIAANLEKGGFKEAAEHMRQLQNQTEENSKATSGWGEIVQKVTSYFSLAAIGSFYKFAIEQAMEAAKAQRDLQLRVENAGMAWEKAGTQVNALNQALSEQSRFSKSELDQALVGMIDRTNNVAVAQRNMQLAMGLSVATGRDLASVSKDVAEAAAGNERSTMALAKEFGIVGEKAHDNVYVLDQLAKRYEGLSTKTDDTEGKFAKLKKVFADTAETVGNFWLPVVEAVVDASTRLLKVVESLSTSLVGLGVALAKLATGDLAGAKEALTVAGDAASEAWDYLAGKDPVGGEDKSELLKKNAENARTVYQGLSDELKQIVKDTKDATSKILLEAMSDEKDREEARWEEQKKLITQREDFKRLHAVDQAKVLEAVEAQHQANLVKIEAAAFNNRLQTAVKFGNMLGVATAKMVRGEKDAWKDLAVGVIDMMAQEAQAVVVMQGIKAYMKEVGDKGYVGLATGAGLLAVAAAKAAAIGGVAELAKGAIRGGGGGSDISVPSGGGGGSAGGGGGAADVSASPEAAPERKQATVQVNIQGDMYGDPTFVDRLASKITDAVENRDVRLVSTTTGGS